MQKARTQPQSQPTYLAHRRWTEQEARDVLAAFRESGLRIGAFATREGLDVQRLSRWRRQLAAGTEARAFEEVNASVTRAALEGGAVAHAEKAAFEVVLASGCVVRVPESFDASALRRLLSVVEKVRGC